MKKTLCVSFILIALLFTSYVYSLNLGSGVEAYNQGNYSKAYEIFSTLAEQGDADALFNLGFMHEQGIGTTQNYTEAYRWYRAAAEQGDVEAQFNLGIRYAQEGRGVLQSYVYAHMWSNIAASRGHQKAAELRELLLRRMTPSQVQEAQRLAQEWVNSR